MACRLARDRLAVPRRRQPRPRTPDATARAYSAILGRALAGAEDQILEILAPRLARLDAPGRKHPIRYGLRAVAADVDPREIGVIAARTERANLRDMRRTLPAQLLARIPSGFSPKTLDKWRAKNVDLIQSLVGQELEEITDILDVGFKAGTRVEDIRKEIQGRFGAARSKADLLARDQVLKLNGQITEARQKQAGITEYRWSTSGDERVRPMHAELDGLVFSWGDPPETNDDGDRNDPGGDYQCRCVAVPILPALDADTGD